MRILKKTEGANRDPFENTHTHTHIFFQQANKNQKKSKIFKIGPKINNSARNSLRVIPQA